MRKISISNFDILEVNPIGMVSFFKKHLCWQLYLNPNAVKAQYFKINDAKGMIINFEIAGIPYKRYDTEIILKQIFKNLLDEKVGLSIIL